MRYSQDLLFPGSAIPRISYSQGPLFPESAIPRIHYSEVRDYRDSTPFGSKPHSQGTPGPRTSVTLALTLTPNPNHGNSGPGNSEPWEWRTLGMVSRHLHVSP